MKSTLLLATVTEALLAATASGPCLAQVPGLFIPSWVGGLGPVNAHYHYHLPFRDFSPYYQPQRQRVGSAGTYGPYASGATSGYRAPAYSRPVSPVHEKPFQYALPAPSVFERYPSLRQAPIKNTETGEYEWMWWIY